jgi:hypothetical protein
MLYTYSCIYRTLFRGLNLVQLVRGSTKKGKLRPEPRFFKMPLTRPSANTAAPVKLRFDEKLTGRGLSSDSLQRKLKVRIGVLAVQLNA